MKLKIKSRPEDFIVEEVSDLPIRKKGGFAVYRLEKRGWNTIDLLDKIAGDLKRPLRDVAYGGRKDRHALTRQFITIKSPRVDDFRQKDYALNFCGFCERPMGPDRITGNRFEIIVRNLSDAQVKRAVEQVKSIETFGYPNYFDDQRFGSFDPDQGFIAEKILMNHFNGALKIYLTAVYPEDGKETKERKNFFNDHWRDWKVCKEKAATEFERDAFSHLDRHPGEFLFVLKHIPRERMSLFISAYQSFIWNELVRRILLDGLAGNLKKYPGRAGEYLFYGSLTADNADYLKRLNLPTPSGKVKLPDKVSDRLYRQILEERNVRQALFNKMKIREAYFKSSERRLVVGPKEFSFAITGDDLHVQKVKLVLKFLLPCGSYGTMLLKRLFSE